MSVDPVRGVRTALIMRRLALDLSQRELGEILRIRQNGVAYLERRAGAGSAVGTLDRWARALGCRVEVHLVPLDEPEGEDGDA